MLIGLLCEPRLKQLDGDTMYTLSNYRYIPAFLRQLLILGEGMQPGISSTYPIVSSISKSHVV